MADTFRFKRPLEATMPADRWFLIVPDDNTDFAILPRAILCATDGNLVAIDVAGNSMTVGMTAGNLLPIRPARVGETSTGSYYGLY